MKTVRRVTFTAVGALAGFILPVLLIIILEILGLPDPIARRFGLLVYPGFVLGWHCGSQIAHRTEAP